MPLIRSVIPWLALLFSGCTAFSHNKKTAEQVQEVQQQSDQLVKGLQQTQRQHKMKHDRPWVSLKAIKINNGRLPDSINCQITFATAAPMPLNEFSKLVNKLCGLPVRVTPDAEIKLMGGMDVRKSRSSDNHQQDNQKLTGIRWQGKLDGLLDVVSSSLGLSWKYNQHEVNLYYLDSCTFPIYAIPSETEMKSVVQSGISSGIGGDEEGGGSGKGQSSQATAVSLKSSMVQDIRKSVESMLTPGFGRLSASSATGTITVTDTPETLNRIQDYIDYENKSITKQVLLNVKVLTVALKDKDQFDVNWNLVYQKGKLNALLKGQTSSLTENDRSSQTSIGIIDNNNQFDGTKLLLDALAEQGKVSTVTSPSVTTLNLQPVPVQVATQTSYLAKTETTSTANVGQSVTMTPGTVTSGFNMNLLPFVMANNQLLLQYSINLSELKKINTVGNEKMGSQIQLPEIDNCIFSQKVKLKSGQTLVLSGFEQMSNDASRKGTGTISNWLLGGGVKAEDKRSVIVIMITPVVLE